MIRDTFTKLSRFSSGSTRIVLVVIFSFAFVLRAVNINRESLWFDEAISYLTAQLSSAQIWGNVILDPHPPLYYWTLRQWLSIGFDGGGTGRWLGVVFNLALLPVMWWMSRKWFADKRLRFVLLFLIAISPFHVLYSHELRMYSMLMTLSALVVLFYLQARKRGGWWWAALAVTAVFAMYTHLFAVFVLLALGLHALILHRERAALWRLVLVGVVVIIAFLPWLFILAGEAGITDGSFRPLARSADADITRNPVKLIITPAFLLFGQSFTFWYSGLILFLTVGTAVVLLLEMRKAWREGDRSMLLPLLLVGSVVGGPILVYYVRPFFLPERTMAAASPFLMVLLAWGMTRRGSPLPVLVGVTAVVMVIGSGSYLFGEPIKPPYRESIQFVVEQMQPGDVVLHTSDGSYLPALSYVDLPQHFLLAGDPDQRKPTAVYEAYGGSVKSWQRIEITEEARLWLIVALEHSVEWQKDQVAHAARCYPLLGEADFSGIKVYLYDLSSSNSNCATERAS